MSLACRGLTLRFGDRQVLRGVSLEVPTGTSCAVVGPSGSGKTTLLRVLAGLEAADAGEVWIDGRPVSALAPAERGVSLVFQEPRLFPAMTVGENVAYALRVRGTPRPERARAAAALLEQVGLADRRDERPSSLSGGEQQRVALARALCAAPRVLLLDEPISAVDGPGRTDLRDLIRRVCAAHHVTTVVVTHDLEDATAMGDRLALLVDGDVAQCGRSDDVLDRPVSPAVALLGGNPNVLHAEVVGGSVELGSCGVPVAGPDGPALLTVRPEHVVLDEPGGVGATVVDVERRASRLRVVVTAPFGRLEALTESPRSLRPGDAVTVGIPPGRLWRFPAEAGFKTPDARHRLAQVAARGD